MIYGSTSWSKNPNHFLARDALRISLKGTTGGTRIAKISAQMDHLHEGGVADYEERRHANTVLERLLSDAVSRYLDEVLDAMIPDRNERFHFGPDLEAERCFFGSYCPAVNHVDDPLELDEEADQYRVQAAKKMTKSVGIVGPDQLLPVLRSIWYERTTWSLRNAAEDLELHHVLEALHEEGYVIFDQQTLYLGAPIVRPRWEDPHNHQQLDHNLELTEAGQELLGSLTEEHDSIRRAETALAHMRLDAQVVADLILLELKTLTKFKSADYSSFFTVARAIVAGKKILNEQELHDIAAEFRDKAGSELLRLGLAEKHNYRYKLTDELTRTTFAVAAACDAGRV